MKFRVLRASNTRPKPDDAPPCRRALRVEAEGQPEEEQLWEVEINTIDELIALVEEEGQVIVQSSDSMLIYDDWIE